MKTRGRGVDHRSLLPSGEQITAGNIRKPLLDYTDETLVTKIRIITKPAPYHPMVPVLDDFDLSRRLRLGAHKFPAPNVLVGTQVETPGDIIRDVLYELAHEVRGTPAKMIHIVVAQRPDRFEVAFGLDIFNKTGVIWLGSGTIHVRLGIFEAEDKLNVLMIDQRLELPGNVFSAGLMLAMDESEFSPRLRFGGVKHSLSVGLKRPVFFLLKSGFRHVFARRQANARQIRIRQEHLPDTLAEVVNRSFVVDIVCNAVFSFGSVDKDIPGNNIEIHVAVLCIPHDFAPKLDFLLDGYLL